MKYVVTAVGLGQNNKTDVCSTLENAKRIAEKYCADLNCSVYLAEIIGVYDRKTDFRAFTSTSACESK